MGDGRSRRRGAGSKAGGGRKKRKNGQKGAKRNRGGVSGKEPAKKKPEGRKEKSPARKRKKAKKKPEERKTTSAAKRSGAEARSKGAAGKARAEKKADGGARKGGRRRSDPRAGSSKTRERPPARERRARRAQGSAAGEVEASPITDRRPEGGGSIPASSLDAVRRLSRHRFGIRRLHPAQEQAIRAVVSGRDVVAVLPTGYGKSLIYQVPAMILQRPALVVSPLIALMRDQERGLRRRGVPVARLDSTLKVSARRQTLDRIRKGGSLIVLTTPETLEARDARPALLESRPRLLVVDEAHCISEWGHDFRPAYLRLGRERGALGIPQGLALTATATPRVRRQIAERLDLRDPLEVTAPPHRPNLGLSALIAPGSVKIDRAARVIRSLRRPGIIYCATQKAVDEIHRALSRADIPCARYHGGMKTADRNEEQRRYMKGARRMVMVATSAFGMGIDKPDIRYILHYQVPGSPEQYVQEAGRAGRDGRPSECILLFDPADLEIQEFLKKRSRPRPAQLRRVARALEAWAAEEKPVAAKDLALSAEVPAVTCRSLCAELEMAGLVDRDTEKRYASRVPPAELRSRTEDLAARFETERSEDARRLRGIADYAETDECRSVFLRRWFGEDDPPPCGRCDRCREEGRAPAPERVFEARTGGARSAGERRRGRSRSRGVGWRHRR